MVRIPPFERQHWLEELANGLPTYQDYQSSGSEEVGALAVIQRVAREGVAMAAAPSVAILSDPAACPNCGALCSAVRSPYCSERCREEAAWVRQFRSGLEPTDRDRCIALGQKLWRLMGGGLPLRVSLIPEKAAVRYLAKNPLCECGAPATRIDNVGAG